METNSVDILLDGEKVAGHIVKPWTITKAAALSPVFEKIQAELKNRKLSFRDFFAGGATINIDQLFFVIMPYVPEILKITLGITEDEVDKIGQGDLMKFIVVIVQQNLDYLKNLFALIVSMAQMIKEQKTS